MLRVGPLPVAFLLVPVALPLPFALLLRRRRILPWTIEARTYPWVVERTRSEALTRRAVRSLNWFRAETSAGPAFGRTDDRAGE